MDTAIMVALGLGAFGAILSLINQFWKVDNTSIGILFEVLSGIQTQVQNSIGDTLWLRSEI